MLVIIDYGVGNLASIRNMLKKVGSDAIISSDEDTIRAADKLILPGVGAFDTCAEKLRESSLIPLLNSKVLEQKTPVIGVCVGMQLLMEGSEEGALPGLGWIKGRVVKFRQESLPAELKIPHMGWTDVIIRKSSRLFEDMFPEPRFYFVHSYFAQPAHTSDILAQAVYGASFTAAVEHENIAGVQFHPEKSHKFGMKLFENFVSRF